MPALARTSDWEFHDYYSRAANDACFNGGPWTRTKYSYDPYGSTTKTGTATGNTQQYTGRENDTTGLYFYRARYYSAINGRFVSEDPIGWGSGQANNYSYVGGNPIGASDPSGERSCGALVLLACSLLPIGEGQDEIPTTIEQLNDQRAVQGGVDGPDEPEAEPPATAQPSSCPVEPPPPPPIVKSPTNPFIWLTRINPAAVATIFATHISDAQ